MNEEEKRDSMQPKEEKSTGKRQGRKSPKQSFDANDRRSRGGRGKQVRIPGSKIRDIDIKGVDTAKTSSKGSTGWGNDPKWYTNNPELTDNVASIPFNHVLGFPLNARSANSNFTITNSSGSTDYKSSFADSAVNIPGIMRIQLVTGCGISTDANSAINIAAQQVYTSIRIKLAGSVKNYSRTDVMLYLMAMDNAYMLYEYLVRLYRVCTNFESTNRYLPYALVRSMNANPAIMNNLSRFRDIIDNMVFKLTSLRVPKVFDIITRHSWLYSNVYTDADDSKAQMYLFNPSGFHVWTEGTGDDLPYLTWVPFNELFELSSTSNSGITYDNMESAIRTMLDPIVGSDDIGTISSDIERAFGVSDCVKISPVERFVVLQPIYSEEVLTQIENLDYVPFSFQGNTNPNNYSITREASNLTQGEYIVYNPGMSINNMNDAQRASMMRNSLLNFHKSKVTLDDVLVATRLKAKLKVAITDGNNQELQFAALGTEFVDEIAYVRLTGDPLLASGYNQSLFTMDVAHTGTRNEANLLATLAAFDWHPPVYYWYEMISGEDEMTFTLENVAIDYDNAEYVDDETLFRIHRACIISLFTEHGFDRTVIG